MQQTKFSLNGSSHLYIFFFIGLNLSYNPIVCGFCAFLFIYSSRKQKTLDLPFYRLKKYLPNPRIIKIDRTYTKMFLYFQCNDLLLKL
jgi:hypothetical protein